MKRRAVLLNLALAIVTTLLLLVVLELVSAAILATGPSPNYETDYENSLGLRDPREPADVQGDPVILTIGDSFTYGYGVSYEESYPAQLQELLRKTHPNAVVINAGIVGHDTQTAHDLLVRVYDHYRPDWVILGFHSADVVQNQVAYQGLNAGDVSAKESMQEREARIPRLYLFKEFVRQRTRTGSLVNYLYKNYLIKYVPPPDAVLSMQSGSQGEDQFAASEFFLDAIDRFLSNTETRWMMVSMLPLVRFDAFPYHGLNERLDAFARSRGIEFVDPLPAMARYSSTEFWVSKTDGHYNARANRLITELLAERLKEGGLEHPEAGVR